MIFAAKKQAASVNVARIPTISDSKTAAGWTIGAGFEYGLTQNISAKAEYLHFDLGSDTYNLAVPVTVKRTGNIGRAGLNYRFGLMWKLEVFQYLTPRGVSGFAPKAARP